MERIIPDVMKSEPQPQKTEASENINPMFEQERAAPYGYCPECAAPGKMRSKTIGETHDICEAGHSYASSRAVMSQTAAATAPTKQTARFENTHEGMCPSCGQQMRLSTANGIPVHVCMEHSVVMPIRDPEPLQTASTDYTKALKNEEENQVKRLTSLLNTRHLPVNDKKIRSFVADKLAETLNQVGDFSSKTEAIRVFESKIHLKSYKP